MYSEWRALIVESSMVARAWPLANRTWEFRQDSNVKILFNVYKFSCYQPHHVYGHVVELSGDGTGHDKVFQGWTDQGHPLLPTCHRKQHRGLHEHGVSEKTGGYKEVV